MALRSSLRKAVGRPGGAQMVERSHHCSPYVFRIRPMFLPSHTSAPSSSSVALKDVHYDEACTMFSGPSTSDTEPESSVCGRCVVAQLSLGDARDPPNLNQSFQRRGDNSILDPGGQGRIILDRRTQWFAFDVMSGSSLAASVVRNGEQKVCNWWSQGRRISSSGGNCSPRKMERYSGRPADRDLSPRLADRQVRFDENFKRLPVIKKPQGEYRQGIVDNSTKNMPLVPKKWKRALPTKEVLDAVMYLRRAKSNPDAVKEVVRKRVARMLKLEMMLVLSELQRLDECFLAHQVFDAVRKEPWYKPNVYLYQTMVQTFGTNNQIKGVLRMFEELRAEGLQPDESINRELLRAYVICDMMSEAIKVYKEIQKSGPLDKAARSILFHGLNEEQKLELAVYEKAQRYDWS